jgi:hypothetical protein
MGAANAALRDAFNEQLTKTFAQARIRMKKQHNSDLRACHPPALAL